MADPVERPAAVMSNPSPVAAAHLENVLDRTRTREMLGLVLDTAPIAVALLDTSADFRVVHCNPFFERLLPEEERPPIGRPFDAVPSAGAEHVRDTLGEVVRTRQPGHFRHYEFVGQRQGGPGRSGGVTVWNWDVHPVEAADGAVTHLFSVGTDITEQTLARRAMIQASEDTLRTVLDVSRHIGVDPDLPTLFGRLSATIAELAAARSIVFCRLQDDGTLAAQPEAHGIDGAHLERLRGLPCDGGGGDVIGAVVHGGEVFAWRPSTDRAPAACRLFLGDIGAVDAIAVPWWAGERRLGALIAVDPPTPRGFSEEAVSTLRVAALAAGLVWQLTEAESQLALRREAEAAELRSQRGRMEELESIKSEFLNLAAHELRGPVTVLRGYLSMLDDGSLPAVTGKARDALPLLLSRANHINRLIDDMLDAARLEEGRLELAPEIVDLGTAAMVVIETVGPLATPRHNLRLRESPAPVLVRGDWNRIYTMLADLVENAIKYSPDGGDIECEVGTRDGSALVIVRDQGLGIPEEEVARLFTRFGRTVRRETSHIPGSGLGLYLARELARLHGGDVTVETELGVGSAFTLTLPLAGEEVASGGS